jgi:hypothetical protein
MSEEMINKAVESIRQMIKSFDFYINEGLTLEQAKENLSEDFGFIKGAKILLEAM